MNPVMCAVIERIGIALVHSLWQGSLVGIALLIGLLALRRASAQLRYLACCLALIVTLLLPVATFIAVRTDAITTTDQFPQETATSDSAFVTSAARALEAAVSLFPEEVPHKFEPVRGHGKSPMAGRDARPPLSGRAEQLLMAIVVVWVAGVVVLSCRLLGGYFLAYRLTRRRVAPLDEAWRVRCRRLAARLGVRRTIEWWQSTCIEVPAVLGCIRPVVLVPVGMLTGLPADQVEAVLAHELAHVCRYDFLVNAVQCLIETLLFYHPCVWWISARIRAEREHCCDELAVAACGDALVFARALASVEQLRPPARLAVALTAGGSLLRRIRRVIGQPRSSDVVGGWLAGTLAIALPLAIGGTWAWGRVREQSAEVIAADQGNGESFVGRNAADAGGPPTSRELSDRPGMPIDIPQPPNEERIALSPAVDFLIPPRHGRALLPGDAFRRLIETHGSDRTVKVVVTGLPGDVYNHVYQQLSGLLPNIAYYGSGNGDIATVHLAPISDLDYFASLIDLGHVTSIDRENRVITVVADRSRLPRPRKRTDAIVRDAIDPPTADLPSLVAKLANGDMSVIEELVAFGSDAELPVSICIEHDQRRVRRAALLVLKRVATATSLPVLLKGLEDSDVGNRDLAWQTICHVPGAIHRQEVLEAATALIGSYPDQAGNWLVVVGSGAETAVWPYLRHSDDRVRLRAVDVLQHIGTMKSLAIIDEMADDSAEEIGASAMAAREAILRRQR